MVAAGRHPLDTSLKNREEICQFYGEDWKTIKQLIDEEGFPAAKFGKSWYSDQLLVTEWSRKRISTKG